MYAYAGKILRVNLSTGKSTTKSLPWELVREYVGGKGVGTRLLYDEVKPGIDALGPQNKLIFTTGPATGTILPNKGYCVTFKSPLTNIYGQCSSGGMFGAELKHAGYDILIIEGGSKKPVYLWIDDDNIQLKDAKHLWGKDTFETDDQIKEELDDEEIKVARIGQAGERLVKIATIQNDYSRSAARCGVGAVMGSKNLKAIAVRGTRSIEVARIDDLLDFAKNIGETMRAGILNALSDLGTGGADLFHLTNEIDAHPTRYWHKGSFAEHDNVCPEAFNESAWVKSKACNSCVINCAKLAMVKEGPYKGAIVEGPEYETAYSLGGLCMNSNLGSLAKANELCDKYGIDTISAGSLVAFAMDCYEHGIISEEDTEGIKLTFGNTESVPQLMERISLRVGLGDLLAEGIVSAARRLGKGAEELAIHVKGLDPAGYDPRALKGMALAYAIADRGACHLPANVYLGEIFGSAGGRSTVEGKAAVVRTSGIMNAVGDSLILCRFSVSTLWVNLTKVFPLLIGIEKNELELERLGERIITLARAFSVREGISKKDDILPRRFFEEPLEKVPALKKGEFEKMLNEYYELMRWDYNGIPTQESLKELGLVGEGLDFEPLRQKSPSGE